MKKMILAVIFSSFMFAGFIPSQMYSCKTLGISFKENNKTVNVPNNKETEANFQKTLKGLYAVKIKFVNQALKIFTKDGNDTLNYVKKYKNLDVFVTKDKQGVIFVDNNLSQIGFMIPARKTMIYYQCK